MGWRVWGERFETSDLTGTRVAQPVTFNSNIALRGARVWCIFYNDPTFTNLNLKIYSDNAASDGPRALIATSTDVKTKAEIITLANGVKEFDFTFADITLNADTKYWFVINGTGYTGSTSSHIAWMRGWPDPVHTLNVDSSYPKLGVAPYAIYFIGGEI